MRIECSRHGGSIAVLVLLGKALVYNKLVKLVYAAASTVGFVVRMTFLRLCLYVAGSAVLAQLQRYAHALIVVMVHHHGRHQQ